MNDCRTCGHVHDTLDCPREKKDIFPPEGCTCDPPSHSGHYSYCPLGQALIERMTW